MEQVKCKDCKKAITVDGKEKHLVCNMLCRKVSENFYCAFAEKKET